MWENSLRNRLYNTTAVTRTILVVLALIIYDFPWGFSVDLLWEDIILPVWSEMMHSGHSPYGLEACTGGIFCPRPALPRGASPHYAPVALTPVPAPPRDMYIFEKKSKNVTFAFVRLNRYSCALRVYKFLNSLFFHDCNALPHLLVTLNNVMRRSTTALVSDTGQLSECTPGSRRLVV